MAGAGASWTYDDADKILSAVSGGVSQAYGYDGAGRMTSLRNGQIELQYDYDDRVASITSNGSYTSYTYNGLGSRVAVGTQKIRRDGAGVTSDLLSDGSFSYNQGISPRTSGTGMTSLGNGAAELPYGYDDPVCSMAVGKVYTARLYSDLGAQ